MATLKDVAKDAGVSIATVSCCLSGSKPVKPETRLRIMDSIEKLKYIPNASARNLKITASNRIGVVLTDIDNLYHAEIFKGISSALQNRNYTVSVAFSNNSPDIESEKIDDFISQNISGLIIITCQPQNTDFFKHRIKDYHIPAVFIEHCPDNLFVNFVSFDNYQTSYYITGQLLKKGYRNIALITGNRLFSSERECISGYEDAFSHNGLTADSRFICTTNMSKEDSFKSVLTCLDPVALQAAITTSDTITQGVLEALHIYGIKVANNLQLISFSEENWNTAARFPNVIYSSRTAFTLGSSAAALLLQNIKSPLLFEEKTVTFSDDMIKSPLDVPTVDALEPYTPHIKYSQEGLRILMVDLVASRSTQILSENFTKRTGIPISYDFLPQNQMLPAIISDVNSGKNKYDIYTYDVPWLEYIVQNSLVSDLSYLINDKNFPKDSFFPENLNNCKYEDNYYGVPFIGGSQILFYRKDIFENRSIKKQFQQQYQLPLRPPRTWTEFNGIARFFTKSCNPASPTQFGTSFAGIIDEELAPELLIRIWSYGGHLWDSYNRACLNIPENRKAFESILETLQYVENPPFDTSIHTTVEDFSSGKTAMLITYSEYATQICRTINHNLTGQVGYEILPGKTPMSLGWNLGLNPFTAKTEYADLYFHWLCQHRTSFYMTILDGQSPVMAPYHSHELLNLYPWMDITEKSFQYTHKRNGPYSAKSLVIPQNKIEAVLCQVLKLIVIEQLPLLEALESGQKRMVSLFKDYGYPKPLHLI